MTRIPSSEIWSAVHAERAALVADLEMLAASAWQTPSLCPTWDVHDVVAHLVDSAKTTRWSFVRRLVAARFDFDRDNAAGIAREKAADPSVTLGELLAVSTYTRTPPAALATRLVEAFVHGEDIRRPLGIPGVYPAAHVAAALAYQVKTGVSMGGGKERAAGWRLVASDADFAQGEGPEVGGTAISLLMAVSGRAVDATELTGAGAPDFSGALEQ
ncbi:maleylpyruvate isomerase family mycothiol-dependent enzyme [Arthrobacter sp. H35-D1]|uniref:maleylpyruvate isomerase family mycothiol-dependent enzyme n=1 Tax=Arthrobacter sp. H35-D1 TaxID=3046202 RepID=UPI0024B90770|nr:maleylpyruvate isomerase family mycothiol-dependent enzyme [Arthrobacter sp. H35-D1]MDJ0314827.1 maleylpyruvate isomerase family mycothiol-dependent enzyme [Arthrobacter sp. H35-D1]